jgi:hypothetical protein
MIANLIVAAQHDPRRARRFREAVAAHSDGTRIRGIVASDRHRLEVNYYDYRRLLKRLMRRFGPVRAMKLEPRPDSKVPQAATAAEAAE